LFEYLIYGYFDREFLEIGICPGLPKRSLNFLNTHNVVDSNFDFEKMKQFLINCSYIPNDNLILAIIRRIDLNNDAKLNMKEFI
jgi:hypothetical protein